MGEGNVKSRAHEVDAIGQPVGRRRLPIVFLEDASDERRVEPVRYEERGRGDEEWNQDVHAITTSRL